MEPCMVRIGDKMANARIILRPHRGRISKDRIRSARSQITARYGIPPVDIHVYAHGDNALALYFVKPVFTLVADDVEVWRGHTEPTQAQIDRAAGDACSRGWNGVVLDLYRESQWIRQAEVSPHVLG
jgi:hypothetical protein